MLTYEIKKGSTNRIIAVPFYDSSSATGALLGGVLYNSSGLACYFDRTGSNSAPVSVTLTDMTKGTYTSGGFIAKGTGMTGLYDFCPPNSALATGTDEVLFHFYGAANLVPKTIRIKLVDNEEVDTYSIVNNGTYGNSALKTLIDTITAYVDEIESRLTAQRAANLDELGATNIPADIDSLLLRLTNARAALLDKLNISDSIASSSELSVIDTLLDSVKAVTDKLNTMLQEDGDVSQFTANALENAPASEGGGGIPGDYAITINAHDEDGNNIVDAVIRIWDSVGTSFIEGKITNSSGQVIFNLNTGSYIVKIHKSGYSFDNNTLVVETASKSVTYTGESFIIGPPQNPELCRIYGYYFQLNGLPFSSKLPATIKSNSPYTEENNNFFSTVNGKYNTLTGELYFEVVRGAEVTLKIAAFSIEATFTVPNTSTAKIEDLII